MGRLAATRSVLRRLRRQDNWQMRSDRPARSRSIRALLHDLQPRFYTTLRAATSPSNFSLAWGAVRDRRHRQRCVSLPRVAAPWVIGCRRRR